MKLLFAHDHRFFHANGRVFSEHQFTKAFWERYLASFDTVRAFVRSRELPNGYDVDKLTEVCSARVQFSFGPNLSSPVSQVFRRSEARRILASSLSDVDAVIARLPSELGLLAISEARRAGKPWAVEVAGCPWDGLWNYGSWQGKLYAPVMAFRVRSAVARAPFALYVTRDFLQQRYPNSIGTTVNCSNVEIPEPDKTVLDARLARIQSGVDQPFVLGLIGTLGTRYKGIQTVFEALSRARDALPPVQFRVLGSGDSAPWALEAKRWGVSDLVRFDGVLPAGKPVLSWLDGVDLYLQPSFKEGLPRALIEAMSRGCPAIASDCGGIPELLDRDCLIKPGDAAHLAALLVKKATDGSWQLSQAQRNWDVSSEYSAAQLGRRRADFWSQFAAYVQRCVEGAGA